MDRQTQQGLSIAVHANGFERYNKPVDFAVDASQMHKLGIGNVGKSFTADSLNVVEVSEDGQVLDQKVQFQFDCIEGTGCFVLLLSGVTQADATRYFRIKRKASSKTSPVTVHEEIIIEDNIEHSGQESYRITTPNGVYLYHIHGAGFASLYASDGHDWITHRPGGGPNGRYRGIPNLVHPEGYFHPGDTGCVSHIVRQGPLCVTIVSESKDKEWACTWDVYSYYVTLTVRKAARPYWFLYEGTPGGKLDEVHDYIVRSDGVRTSAAESWDEVLPTPEWLYFGSGNSPWNLYLAHHEPDDCMDSYWPMEHAMTVFGFGRQGLEKYMTQAPTHFTVGFAQGNDFAAIAREIEASYRPVSIQVDVYPSEDL